MGSSGGAVVSLLMSIFYPDCVLACIADGICLRHTPELFERYVARERAQRTEGQVTFWQHAHGDDWQQVVDADTRMVERFVRDGGDFFQGRLREIQSPVLLTGAKDDHLFISGLGGSPLDMFGQIDNCRLYIHSEGGHPFMWTESAVFRAVADLFLGEIGL